jgi:hypothetical protein
MLKRALLALTFVAALAAAGVGAVNKAEAGHGCGYYGGGFGYGGYGYRDYYPSYYGGYGHRYHGFYGHGHRHYGHYGHGHHHGHGGVHFSIGF